MNPILQPVKPTFEQTTLPFTAAVAQLGEEIISRDEVIVVAISGCTCAGKSYFADALNTHLSRANCPSVTLPLDNYFKDYDDPTICRVGENVIFDSPDSFCRYQFRAHVLDLIKQKPVQMPDYDLMRNKRKKTTSITITPARVIIAEGIYAVSFLQELSVQTYYVFMDTPFPICITRRIARDVEKWKVSSQKAELHFKQKILPFMEFHLRNEKNISQFIINPEITLS
jgi:uridine kinase